MGAKREITRKLFNEGIIDESEELNAEECKKFKKLQEDDNYELPDDIFESSEGGYMKIVSRCSDADEIKMILLKQLKLMSTIKSCLIFFTVLTVVSIIIILFFMLAMRSVLR